MTPELSRNRRFVLTLVNGPSTLGVISFLALTAGAVRSPFFGWDPILAGKLQSLDHPLLEKWMIWVSLPGDGWTPFALVGLVLAFLLVKGRKADAGFLLLGTGLGGLVNRLLKAVVDRPRPTEDQLRVLFDFPRESFPSGHVTFYILFFGFLPVIARRRGLPTQQVRALRWFGGALIALSGPSRVYLGAHWPSDVLAAYLGAGLGLYLLRRVYLRHTA